MQWRQMPTQKETVLFFVYARMRFTGNFVKVLLIPAKKLGWMWECPDFFFGRKAGSVVSPMEMMPEGLKFHVGHGTIYLIGTYDKNSHAFTREDVQPLDSGIDFYAPQTMKAPDGRRIMIAWMQAIPSLCLTE